MRPETFKNEAEHCRRQAETAFIGRPESRLLLQLAGAFEALALARPSISEQPNYSPSP
jgi:hypothetical protein